MKYARQIAQVVLLGSLLLLFLSGCMSATIYTAEDFDALTPSHDKVAILPFEVTFDVGHQDRSAEEIENLEIQQGEDFQRALYTQFLQQKQKKRYSIEFQDIDDTNALLTRALDQAATREKLSSFTKSEICEILDVDALISGDLALSKTDGSWSSNRFYISYRNRGSHK